LWIFVFVSFHQLLPLFVFFHSHGLFPPQPTTHHHRRQPIIRENESKRQLSFFRPPLWHPPPNAYLFFFGYNVPRCVGGTHVSLETGVSWVGVRGVFP
jgi:hypothetical protein